MKIVQPDFADNVKVQTAPSTPSIPPELIESRKIVLSGPEFQKYAKEYFYYGPDGDRAIFQVWSDGKLIFVNDLAGKQSMEHNIAVYDRIVGFYVLKNRELVCKKIDPEGLKYEEVIKNHNIIWGSKHYSF
jgi:hypothetical protein